MNPSVCKVKVMTKKLIRIQRSRNPHGKGWQLKIHFGCCAGYRALDFPWHSQSIHSPGWQTKPWLSYIPGYTFTLTRSAKVYNTRTLVPRRRPWWISFTSNGNSRLVVPGWWS
jgi:hypothetical protein